MYKRFFRFILLFVVLLSAGLLLYVLIPRSYHVPQLKERSGTQFWSLSTGSRIAYTMIRAKGPEKPYPIIFLQGGPGGFITERNIQIFSNFADSGYNVYLYDQIGSGHSDRLKDISEYTADRHKRDLEEIVKKISSAKVILIGQSWGAILATLFVADNSEKAYKLIVTGPGPIQPYKPELTTIKAPDSLYLTEPSFTNKQAVEKTTNLRIKAIAYWAGIFGSKLASDREVDDYQTLLNNELNKSTVCKPSNTLTAEGGGGFYVQLMTVNSFSEVHDPRPKLRNCRIPVLVMKGQCDNQHWGFTNEYLEIFSNHRLAVIPNAGHSISIEQPLLYINTITRFLNE